MNGDSDDLVFSWKAELEPATAGTGGAGGASGGSGGLAGAAGSSGTGPNASPAGDDDSGCGCRVPSSTNAGATWLGLGLLGALALRRRRR
jgi:arabinoxylan arabinofuranohydrolase